MASLKDIRRRISSVKSTQQITKAMKMVAAARLRRAQETINGARPFAERIEGLTQRIISDLAAGIEPAKQSEFLAELHPLLSSQTKVAASKAEKDSEGVEAQTTKRVALIVVTSDKGLCGGYNTNAIRNAVKNYEDLQSEEGVKPELFFIGKKGYEFFKKNGIEGHWFKDFWTGPLNAYSTGVIAKHFVDKFIAGDFDRVEVSYTEFRTALTQIVSHKVLLPLGAAASSSEQSETEAAEIIYKPGRKELLSKLIPKQVDMQFFKVFADSMASEFGARMTAMDSATTNAKEMIADLTLEANRVRQAAITTELMEIVSGAEALKG
jgi:F-type H+-transporting ATPase subunit gamma